MSNEEIKRKRMTIALVCLFSILLVGVLLLIVILTADNLNKHQVAFFFCIIVFAMGIGLAIVGNVIRHIGVQTEEVKTEG